MYSRLDRFGNVASEMKKALNTVQEHNGELTWQFTSCIGKHVVVACHMQWLLRQDRQCTGPSLIVATGVSESQITLYDVCTGRYGCTIIVTLSSLIGEVLHLDFQISLVQQQSKKTCLNTCHHRSPQGSFLGMMYAQGGMALQ